jgi:prepilin-type N-terminal cleavage/methylation domain-containing protein
MGATRRSGERGLTLVEIVIAMTILAVVVLGMGQFAFNFSRSERLAEARTIAVNLADQRLSEIRASPNYSGIDSIYGINEGSVGGFPGFSRTTTIVHTGGPKPTFTNDYKTVTVTVVGPPLSAPIMKTIVVAAP